MHKKKGIYQNKITYVNSCRVCMQTSNSKQITKVDQKVNAENNDFT